MVQWRRLFPAVVCAAGVGLALPASGMALPPGYGYEKVSPGAAAKGDADVQIQYGAVHSAADGTRVTYEMQVASDTDEGSFYPSQALATLTGSGWSVRGVTPPVDPDLGGAVFDNRIGYQRFSDDLSSGALVQGDPGLVPGAATGDGIRNIYRRDLAGGDGYQLVTPPPAGRLGLRDSFGQSLFQYAPIVIDNTPDLRQIVFETSFIALTPDAAEGFGVSNVYEWADGTVKLVSVLDDGRPSPTGAVAGAGGYAGLGPDYASQQPGGRVMSDDGRRIFFTVPRSFFGSARTGDVYVRIDGSTTRLVSRSQRDVADPDGRQPAFFASASDDGRYAFVASQEKLTNDSMASVVGGGKRDLYRYDVVGDRLIDLMADLDANARFSRVVGTSRDGGTIYFVTEDQRLWVWDGDVTRLVADPGREDGYFVPRNGEYAIVNSQKQSAMSDDGRWLVISTTARLTDRDPAGTIQFYLYDRDRDRVVSCVSCPRDRSPSSNAWTNNRVNFTDLPIMRDYAPRAFNAAGDRFTFITADRLVDEDKNTAFDVYQYNVDTGAVSLISPGTGTENSYFVDASADGQTVFFATRNRVLPQDDDGLIDLYVARPGAVSRGDDRVPPCTGDACQGPLTTPPADLMSGTVTFSGPGDVDETPRERVFTIEPVTSAQVTRFARSGRLRLSVRVSDAGTISAVARGKFGKRTQVVARTTKRVNEGGTAAMTIALSRAARRQLARQHALRVTISVSFSDGGTAQRASLLLKRPAAKAKRGAR